VKPWNVDDEDMEDIIEENYFTVEGEVVKRQNMSKFKNQSRTKNAHRWLKIKKFLDQEANRQKYELFEELIKNEGHEAGIDFFFDEKQSWLKKFANYEWPVLTSLSKKDEMFVNTDVNNPVQGCKMGRKSNCVSCEIANSSSNSNCVSCEIAIAKSCENCDFLILNLKITQKPEFCNECKKYYFSFKNISTALYGHFFQFFQKNSNIG